MHVCVHKCTENLFLCNSYGSVTRVKQLEKAVASEKYKSTTLESKLFFTPISTILLKYQCSILPLYILHLINEKIAPGVYSGGFMVAVAEYVCSGWLLVGFGVKFIFVSSVSLYAW